MPDPIAMVQVFAELRYGVVAHTLVENSVKYGLNFNQPPYLPSYLILTRHQTG